MALFSTRSDDMGKLVLRLVLGVVILFHGYFKLTHGIEWIVGMLGNAGFLAYGVYVAEVVAPVLLILGIRTRLAGIIIAFNMLMAIMLVFKDHMFAAKEMGGGWAIELEALLLFGSLALFFMGGGRFGVSRMNRWD